MASSCVAAGNTFWSPLAALVILRSEAAGLERHNGLNCLRLPLGLDKVVGRSLTYLVSGELVMQFVLCLGGKHEPKAICIVVCYCLVCNCAARRSTRHLMRYEDSIISTGVLSC